MTGEFAELNPFTASLPLHSSGPRLPRPDPEDGLTRGDWCDLGPMDRRTLDVDKLRSVSRL